MSIFDPSKDYGEIVEGSAGPVKDMLIGAINGVLSLLGVILILVIVYGGFMRMFSGGDDKKLAFANKILYRSVSGAIIVLMSYVKTNFVFDMAGN